MDDSGPNHDTCPNLSLERNAGLVGCHRYLEDQLFALTGRWSVDAASGGGPGSVAEFFATQSAIHAWRHSEWERRSPRSVEVVLDAANTGWDRALAVADAAGTPVERLACWSQVLSLQLAARYHRHLSLTVTVADAGLQRWLDIAQRDVLRGAVEGCTLLARTTNTSAPAEVVAQCLGPLLELGV